MAMGISALLGWNCILASLDYLDKQFPKGNVRFVLPVPQFVAINLIGLTIFKISQYISMTSRIILSVITQSLVLVLVPIMSQAFPHGAFGLTLELLFSFLQGLFGTILQSSVVAFASVFHRDNYMGIYFTGTGLSGLAVTVFQFLLMSLTPHFHNKLFWVTLIYFLASILALFVTLIYYIRFRRTSYCR